MADINLVGLSVALHEAPNHRGVAVLLPGFLDSKDYASSLALARQLPLIGITAVRFDPRGTWQSGGCSADCTITQQIHDVATIFDSLPPADPDRRIVIGYCYGAYVAALSAASDEKVSEVVAIMPTRSFIWTEDYDRAKDTWWVDGERRYVREAPGSAGTVTVRVPYSVVEDAKRYRMADAWENLRQPILFVAGGDDLLITPESVRALHDKCGSQRKDLTVLAGVHHDYRYDEKQIEKVNRTVLEWLGVP
ncbi:MAG TPA: alpha/beta hydrolase [Pseudonocardiaceae bacterium]